MSTIRNRVRLIGNIGNSPEVMTLENGRKVARFSLATNETYKNEQDEKVTETQWHNIVTWGKTAEIIESYAGKGKEIAVEGKLTYRSYENKNGEKRYTVEIIVADLLLL